MLPENFGVIDYRPIFDKFEPHEILLNYDGPRIFTAIDKTGRLRLVYQCDEFDNLMTWLIVPTTDEIVYQLKTNTITLYDALMQKIGWLLITSFNYDIVQSRMIEPKSMPDTNMPDHDAYLHRVPMIVE